jgi:hypothetical protein
LIRNLRGVGNTQHRCTFLTATDSGLVILPHTNLKCRGGGSHAACRSCLEGVTPNARPAPSPIRPLTRGPLARHGGTLSDPCAASVFSGSAICFPPYVRSIVPQASAGLGAPGAAAVSQLHGHAGVSM